MPFSPFCPTKEVGCELPVSATNRSSVCSSTFSCVLFGKWTADTAWLYDYFIVFWFRPLSRIYCLTY